MRKAAKKATAFFPKFIQYQKVTDKLYSIIKPNQKHR